MRRIRPDVDIIMDVLKAVLEANPASAFIQSLLQQYQERGGLSKKQLEGLYGKASRLDKIPPARLATLEAIILKKKSRQRSDLPAVAPLYTRDEDTGRIIAAILDKFPQHKRVLFFRSKYENNEPLSAAELTDLKRFEKLLR
ncbi:MAG: hypothetical protein JNM88_13965 [Chitinophagaceae bacterium]|nr:hypothetical protein [Chitinophagaceae bacterium]